jgi:hypothetical protein
MPVTQHHGCVQEIAARQDRANAKQFDKLTLIEPAIALDDNVMRAGGDAAKAHHAYQKKAREQLWQANLTS